jgi:hypothetical protein
VASASAPRPARLPTRQRLLLGGIAAAFPDIDFLGFLVDPLVFLAESKQARQPRFPPDPPAERPRHMLSDGLLHDHRGLVIVPYRGLLYLPDFLEREFRQGKHVLEEKKGRRRVQLPEQALDPSAVAHLASLP